MSEHSCLAAKSNDLFSKTIIIEIAKIVKVLNFPSEAHAKAGRRPAVARSERSERSVREALFQKIELF